MATQGVLLTEIPHSKQALNANDLSHNSAYRALIQRETIANSLSTQEEYLDPDDQRELHKVEDLTLEEVVKLFNTKGEDLDELIRCHERDIAFLKRDELTKNWFLSNSAKEITQGFLCMFCLDLVTQNTQRHFEYISFQQSSSYSYPSIYAEQKNNAEAAISDFQEELLTKLSKTYILFTL